MTRGGMRMATCGLARAFLPAPAMENSVALGRAATRALRALTGPFAGFFRSVSRRRTPTRLVLCPSRFHFEPLGDRQHVSAALASFPLIRPIGGPRAAFHPPP